LKRHRRQDAPSRAEIAFEWDILFGDFYDRVCARMDLDPKDVALGYKFDVDPKNSIVRLPSNDLAAFNKMLEKIKSRIVRTHTRAMILEIHELVCLTHSIEIIGCSFVDRRANDPQWQRKKSGLLRRPNPASCGFLTTIPGTRRLLGFVIFFMYFLP
jgi:hypothetical protein